MMYYLVKIELGYHSLEFQFGDFHDACDFVEKALIHGSEKVTATLSIEFCDCDTEEEQEEK